MKRIFTLLTLLVLTGLVLPSCGVTLVKRQHTGGYYVNTNPRKHTAKEDHSAVKPEEQTASAIVETPAETAMPEEQLATAPVREAAFEEAIVSQEKPAVQEDNAPLTNEVAAAEPVRAEKTTLAKVTDRISPVKQVNKMKAKARAMRGDSEGLSLFWIVILILLVLWALGLIGGGWGLGWVINLLLIVALVLLILWLLRIV